jgi:hypothetical protein
MDIVNLGARLAPRRTAGKSRIVPRPDSFKPCCYGSFPQKETSNVLQEYVSTTKPWSRERVPVPRRLRWALWAVIPVELFWAVWLATIVTGATACRGPICRVTILDHHAAALLACGIFCVVGLVGLMPMTRGFSKGNDREVIGLAIAAAAGGASLLGLAAFMIGALILVALLVIFVLASTATSRREINDARPRTPFPIALDRSANRSRAHSVER